MQKQKYTVYPFTAIVGQEEMFSEVYGVDVHISEHNGKPYIVPLGRAMWANKGMIL